MTSEKEKKQAYNKASYEWCKEHKICVCCQKEDVANGRVTCEKCKEKRKQHYKSLSDDEKKQRIKIQKARYWARREAGVCIDCGEALAETSSYFCPKHLKMRRIRESRYYYNRKAKNNVGNTCASG